MSMTAQPVSPVPSLVIYAATGSRPLQPVQSSQPVQPVYAATESQPLQPVQPVQSVQPVQPVAQRQKRPMHKAKKNPRLSPRIILKKSN